MTMSFASHSITRDHTQSKTVYIHRTGPAWGCIKHFWRQKIYSTILNSLSLSLSLSFAVSALSDLAACWKSTKHKCSYVTWKGRSATIHITMNYSMPGANVIFIIVSHRWNCFRMQIRTGGQLLPYEHKDLPRTHTSTVPRSNNPRYW